MKKNTIRCYVVISIFWISLNLCAQAPGCPNLDAGPDQTTDCNNLCTDLTASFLETGLTTTYEVSDVPYTPPFPFTGLANPISLGVDDIWSEVIDLPFNFCFFGDTYSKIQVGSNGVMRLEVDPTDPFNAWEFDEDIPNNTTEALSEANIFGVAHDIDPSITTSSPEIGWELLGSAPCRTFVVSFSSVAHFSASCNNLTSTFQLVLYETTNVIEVYIQDKPFCTSWNDGNAIVGIQNNEGTIAYVAPGRNTSDSPWETNDEAWRFIPNGPPNYEITWSDPSGMVISNTPTATVCPQTDTVYTAQIVYTNCDGQEITLTDDVTVEGTDSASAGEDGALEICENGDPVDLFTQLTGASPTPGGVWTPALNSGTGVFDPTIDPVGVYTYTVSGTNCPDDSADVTVTLVNQPSAGESSTLALCENTIDPIDLFTILEGTPDPGGIWTPALNSGTGVYTPGIDAIGVYTYTVTGAAGCNDDQTSVTIQEIAIPLITNITTQCQQDSYTIQYQTDNNVIITSSSGTVDESNNVITDIPNGTDVVITATSDLLTSCSSTTTVVSPDCYCEQITLETPEPICVDSNGQPIDGFSFPVLDSDLDPSLFSILWSIDGVVIPGETSVSITAETAGTYTIQYISNTTGTCSGESTVNVIFAEGPSELTLALTNGIFSQNNGIVASVTGGEGPYEYALDQGSFQENNVFENVSLGNHTVTVRQINGCGTLSETIFVLGFPNFFTPNNDGFNDFWNVIGDTEIPDMNLFIFDRYGKLMTQLDPNGIGWDGTYNGQPMPTTDYWFVAELKDGSGTYRSHFSLKR